MRRVRWAMVLSACLASASSAQAPRVDDPAADGASRLLRDVLAAPRIVVRAPSDSAASIALARADRFAATVVIVGTTARVASSVRGDVIVIGGDLFLHPGAMIDGRAIAIGGAVYGSTLALVGGGTQSYRDHTFDMAVRGSDTVFAYRLLDAERKAPVEFPLIAGLRIPSYDRVNGLAVPWGPLLTRGDRLEVEPIVTYRSDLGAFDLSGRVTLDLRRGRSALLVGGRGTLTNEGWIRGDPINSLTAIATGSDVRNYYRADRLEARLGQLWRRPAGEVEGSLGVATERAWSVGPGPLASSAPWSLIERHGMLRENPSVDRGRISAALVGGRLRWQLGDVSLRGVARVEIPWDAPGDAQFAQGTIDADVAFPTFLDHRFEFSTHAVVTAGDRPPAQRFAYIGGSGTIPTDSLLATGGDQLLWSESRYVIPFARVRVPFLGSPSVAIRYLVGAAGVDALPSFAQNIGMRVSLGFFKVDMLFDPASRESDFSAGLSLIR